MLKVVLDLQGVQASHQYITAMPAPISKCIDACLKEKDLQLIILLSAQYASSLRPIQLQLKQAFNFDGVQVYYPPQIETGIASEKHARVCGLIYEAFVQAMSPDLLIYPQYETYLLYDIPVKFDTLTHINRCLSVSDALTDILSQAHLYASEKKERLACYLGQLNEVSDLMISDLSAQVAIEKLLKLSPHTTIYTAELQDHTAFQRVLASAKRKTKRRASNDAIEKNESKPRSVNLTAVSDLLMQEVDFSLNKVYAKNCAKTLSLNFLNHKTRYLYLDISMLVQQDAKTGIHRVVRSLLSALMKSPPKDYQLLPVYASGKEKGYRAANGFMQRFLNLAPQTNPIDEPIEPRMGDRFLGLDFATNICVWQSDYLNQLHARGVRLEFIVYDLLPHLRPELVEPNFTDYFRQWLALILKFDSVYCISKAVADELSAYIDEKRLASRPAIHWFHMGADIESSVPSKGMTLENERLIEKLKTSMSFLMVSTIEPRKGYAQALNVFEALWARGYDFHLVIVGKGGWKMEALIDRISSHPQLNQRLHWLKGISDELLEKLYAVSNCFLGLSEAEGFGLPLIEAGKHELPIIARDIPVFREIAGAHAFFFSGLEPAPLEEAILAWVQQYKENLHPQSKGMPWLTWAESAARLKAHFST